MSKKKKINKKAEKMAKRFLDRMMTAILLRTIASRSKPDDAVRSKD